MSQTKGELGCGVQEPLATTAPVNGMCLGPYFGHESIWQVTAYVHADIKQNKIKQ